MVWAGLPGAQLQVLVVCQVLMVRLKAMQALERRAPLVEGLHATLPLRV